MKQQLEEEVSPKEEVPTVETVSETPIIVQCFICKEEFTSRNALFKHIKDLGHAKPIEVKTETKLKTKTKKK